MSKYRRQLLSVGLDLTPLIDVVFLLLIFFMVTTTFTKETRLSLTLPEATGEPQGNVDEPIEITIGLNSHYALNGVSLARHDLLGIKQALSKLTTVPSQQAIVVTADANAPHQAVITALDAAGQLGFVNIKLTTQAP